MIITLFIYNLSGGGAERVICNLADYLVNSKCKINILTVVKGEQAYSLDARIKIDSLSEEKELSSSLQNYRLWTKRLKDYNSMYKPDCYIAMLLVPIKLILMLRPFIKGKIIISERNDPQSYPFKTKKQLRILARFADGFVFQTPGAEHWYSEISRGKLTRIIPNAINNSFLDINTDNVVRSEYIVAVGRLEKQKNHNLLLEAFTMLSKEFDHYILVIYGEGSLKKDLEARVKELKIENKVEFAGFETNIQNKIKNASLYVLSSDYEGMPNSLIEAMALGIPCISTNCPCGGPEYLIKSGDNGILIPVNNAIALRNAIEALLSNPDKANELGKSAKDIKKILAPEVVYKKWKEFIFEVNGERDE